MALFGKTPAASHTFALVSLATSILLLLLPSTTNTANAELFSAPTLKWSLQLEGSGRLAGRGLRRGNAIVAHKDGTKIVVTADDGSLHVVQTTNPIKTLGVHVPVEIVGKRTECRSGATIVDGKQVEYADGNRNPADGNAADGNAADGNENAANEDFIVYAVIDTTIVPDVGILEAGIIQSLGRNGDKKDKDKDNDNDSSTLNVDVDVGVGVNANARGDAVTSRVIAVGTNGAFRWSVELPGTIEGNPVVGKHGTIYVTHNDNGTGRLSVLRVSGNGTTATAVVVATVSPPATEPGSVVPLGPPSLRTPAHQGGYDDYYGTDGDDDDNTNDDEDVVIVAENWESGFSSTRGGLYMLISTTGTAKGRADDASLFASTTTTTTRFDYNYELVRISSWSYSASAPPMVRGDSIYLGAAAGTIAGFTGDRKNDLSGITSQREKEISPRWNYQVSPNPRNVSQRECGTVV